MGDADSAPHQALIGGCLGLLQCNECEFPPPTDPTTANAHQAFDQISRVGRGERARGGGPVRLSFIRSKPRAWNLM